MKIFFWCIVLAVVLISCSGNPITEGGVGGETTNGKYFSFIDESGEQLKSVRLRRIQVEKWYLDESKSIGDWYVSNKDGVVEIDFDESELSNIEIEAEFDNVALISIQDFFKDSIRILKNLRSVTIDLGPEVAFHEFRISASSYRVRLDSSGRAELKLPSNILNMVLYNDGKWKEDLGILQESEFSLSTERRNPNYLLIDDFSYNPEWTILSKNLGYGNWFVTMDSMSYISTFIDSLGYRNFQYKLGETVPRYVIGGISFHRDGKHRSVDLRKMQSLCWISSGQVDLNLKFEKVEKSEIIHGVETALYTELEEKLYCVNQEDFFIDDSSILADINSISFSFLSGDHFKMKKIWLEGLSPVDLLFQQ
jgi:hypothetical protein